MPFVRQSTVGGSFSTDTPDPVTLTGVLAGSELVCAMTTTGNLEAQVLETPETDGWTKEAVIGPNGTQMLLWLFTLTATTGGTFSVDALVTVNSTTRFHLYEISQVAGMDPVDSDHNSSSVTTSPEVSVTPTAENGLAIAFLGVNGDPGSTPAWGNGFVHRHHAGNLASATLVHSGGSAVSTSATWTTSRSPRIALLNYYGAAAGTPGAAARLRVWG